MQLPKRCQQVGSCHGSEGRVHEGHHVHADGEETAVHESDKADVALYVAVILTHVARKHVVRDQADHGGRDVVLLMSSKRH